MKHFAIFLLTLQRQRLLRHAKTNKRNAIIEQMEQVFSYIISLGASVMMPILFTIIGLCIGLKFGRSLKSGLYVGVGFVGLGIVTALLTTNFGGPLARFRDCTIYSLVCLIWVGPLLQPWPITLPWVHSSYPYVWVLTS